MNKRIKDLRIALNKSQEQFGKLLGVSKSGVCEIESGRRKVTEQHIIMLKNNGVNEEWLRKGEGEMFLPKSMEDELADFTLSLLSDEPESFRSRFVKALANLSVEEWKVLEKLFCAVSEQ